MGGVETGGQVQEAWGEVGNSSADCKAHKRIIGKYGTALDSTLDFGLDLKTDYHLPIIPLLSQNDAIAGQGLSWIRRRRLKAKGQRIHVAA